MKRIRKIFPRTLSIGIHFGIIIISMLKTFCILLFYRIFRIDRTPLHIKEFLKEKKKTGSNLYALSNSLKKLSSEHVLVSKMIDKQCKHLSKQDLIETLPKMTDKTTIIAIPIAIVALGLFRHFITIIVDKEEQIIEFYDPLGLTIFQHDHVAIWGIKCHKTNCLKLSELLSELQIIYKIPTLKEPLSIHQADFTQCAVFVYDRIYKRGTLRLSFDEAAQNPLLSSQAF